MRHPGWNPVGSNYVVGGAPPPFLSTRTALCVVVGVALSPGTFGRALAPLLTDTEGATDGPPAISGNPAGRSIQGTCKMVVVFYALLETANRRSPACPPGYPSAAPLAHMLEPLPGGCGMLEQALSLNNR